MILLLEKKKLIKIIIPIVVVLIVIAITMAIFIPTIKIKSVVNNYAKAMENKKTSEMLEYIDFKGAVAWQNGGFSIDNFSNSDYEDFIKEYNNVKAIEHHNARDIIKDYYNNFFNYGNKENIYINGKANKIGKDLYSIEVYQYKGGYDWGRSGKCNLYYL